MVELCVSIGLNREQGNWNFARCFVGNGFIRSERSVNIRGALDDNGFPFSTFFHSMCTP